MAPSGKLHLSRYRRYLWRDPGLLVVLGGISEVLQGKRLYEQRHRIDTGPASASAELEQLMAAAVLAAMSRADRESWGWSVTLPGSQNGFFCGIEPEGMVCGRVRPAHSAKAAVYLQRQQAGGPLVQSQYEPLSSEPVTAISRYFKQAEQIQTRIVLDGNHTGALVQALPDGDFARVEILHERRLLDLLQGMAERNELELVHEAIVFYECRCNDEMILDLITSLPEESREELWGFEDSLSVECPRCGRGYTIGRVQSSA